jgi:hypothetical protein
MDDQDSIPGKDKSFFLFATLSRPILPAKGIGPDFSETAWNWPLTSIQYRTL